MMATPQRNASLIGDGHDVMGVDAIEKKADQTGPADRRSKKPNSAHGRELFEGISAQFLIMMGDVFAANSVEVIHRGMQSDGAGNIRSACFEPMRRRLPGALMIVDGQNHF